ncbi:MAG TPA: single-stranded-DNA-specific exonuclease RecJ [Balneolales bacterium]|nr:single-stranded-DNA-specific exonuclease RecJ [Balneolales bacterium]
MSFRWVFTQPEDEETVSALQESLGVSDIIARLLAIRGISTFESARSFFRPDLKDIHDPFLMKDMDAAACRVAKAIRESEKAVVYGDYDVDGTTATSIMYTFLKDFGCDVQYYIPHRFKEGYGISNEGVKFAEEQHAGLIISVDCGITAVEEAKYAKELGIDMVICDHHTVGDSIPDALAVLDPKRPDCEYPFDGLSGAGVAFKLIQAVLIKLGLPKEVAFKFLDLLAISIASDIVPIVDENRILMREGLKLLNTNPRPGIKALMKLIKLQPGHIGTSQIVFSIGPRINAAGRLGDATTAVELQIAETEEEGAARAHELEAINLKRRQIDADTMEKAMNILDQEFDIEKDSSVVLHDPEWHLGVIGIVASRLVDRYCRPTIMLSTVDGMVKGSARSIKGFNIYNALKKCDDLLVQFGGHEYAAGLTLMEDQLDLFRERFNEIVFEQLNEEDFEPELIIDADLDLSMVDARFWKVLRQFEPFGPKNLKPIFVSKGLRVIGNPTVVGNGHLKMKVAQNGSAVYDAIGFNMHEFLPAVRTCKNGCLNMAYVLEENTWHNRTTIQMRIKDIQIDT